jgi:aminopeptidase N
MPVRPLRSTVVGLVGLACLSTTALANGFAPGASGSGDPFFPLAGNGGYDVSHYDLDITYAPPAPYAAPAPTLVGRATVTARATQNLSSFNLDLRDFMVASQVRVNGRRATFIQEQGQELVITPQKGLRRGSRFVVDVTYAGTAQAIVDSDDSLEGWVPTDDGAFVVNEPQGSPGWYPVNDTPRDKATYDMRITVPEGKTAVGNGRLISTTTRKGMTTWHWRHRAPMAPYLATATNGTFQTKSTTVKGVTYYDAVDPQTREKAEEPPNRLSPAPDIVAFFSNLYGPYRFSTSGGIIDWAPEVGYALETQTRPNYASIPDEATVVHELSHQWFGDTVTISTWPDIWLNEGFATFSEWYYDEANGGTTVQKQFDDQCAIAEASDDGKDLWFPAPAALDDASQLFGTPVYVRGAMTLQALRTMVGDATFFGLMRSWYRTNVDGNVSTTQFIAFVEKRTGRDLEAFFAEWLYTPGRPAACDGIAPQLAAASVTAFTRTGR